MSNLSTLLKPDIEQIQKCARYIICGEVRRVHVSVGRLWGVAGSKQEEGFILKIS